MDDSDAFFTRTIVGAPCSLLLGRRITPAQAGEMGLELDLCSGRVRLPQAWADFALLGRINDSRGRPRRRPGVVTRWLERYALVVAVTGLVALAASAWVLARAQSWI
jgi:hypothetical protein